VALGMGWEYFQRIYEADSHFNDYFLQIVKRSHIKALL